MKSLSKTIAAVVAAVPLLASAPASALPTTTYDNRTAWESALVGGASQWTEDFNSITADVLLGDPYGPYDTGLISVSAPGTGAHGTIYGQRIDAPPVDFGGFFAIDGTTYLLPRIGQSPDTDPAGGHKARIDFASGVSAFGFDHTFWGHLIPSSSPPAFGDLDIELYSGSTLLESVGLPRRLPVGDRGFFGLTTDPAASITGLLIQTPAGWESSGTNFAIDNISGGATAAPDTPANAVPEPATAALLGLGALSLLARRRRDRVTA
jgi:hypothetical protein